MDSHGWITCLWHFHPQDPGEYPNPNARGYAQVWMA